jgi:mono/diheme cytochrome c family protein
MKSQKFLHIPIIVAVACVLTTPAFPAETVENIYRLYCVQCHGLLGTGEGLAWTSGGLTVQPQNHTSTEHMGKLSDSDIRRVITEGGSAGDKSDLMPPWGKTLSPAEIEELVLYLRNLCQCSGP